MHFFKTQGFSTMFANFLHSLKTFFCSYFINECNVDMVPGLQILEIYLISKGYIFIWQKLLFPSFSYPSKYIIFLVVPNNSV